MLNDVLMCVIISLCVFYDSCVMSSQRYLLKWSVLLGYVDVIEYGSSLGVGEYSRYFVVYLFESLVVVVNVKLNKVYMGLG